MNAPSRPMRAAQYLRMSSDNQRYSTENQQNAIAEYAEKHGYTVVASYIDAGKSGLSLKGRDALKQLLSDALVKERAFDAILVLDISRWGRFQDPDQAAHYEFLCRAVGVRVVYCGEPFGDDAAPITTIVKHLKRVMAGEYSRELSAKLSRAHHQQAKLGFRQGGNVLYGFRRLLVDPARNPRRTMNRGEHKALSTDRVLVIPGPSAELAVVRRIFRLYVHDGLSIAKIGKRLARSGVTGFEHRPLSETTIRHILRSRLCIGEMTYNVTTKRLQGKAVRNPEPSWVRYPVFEPIVPLEQFQKAQDRLDRVANRHWDQEKIAASLRALLAEKGQLSQQLVNEATATPSWETVISHFGSPEVAYAAVGYHPSPQAPFGNNGKHWSKKAVLRGLRKLHATHGRISTRLISSATGLASLQHIRRNFGSIAEAMRQAGLPVLTHSEILRAAWQRRRATDSDVHILGVRWTDAMLLDALWRLYKQAGYVSVSLLKHNDTTPSAHYFIKRFGSVANARLLAKIPVQTLSQLNLAARKRKKEGTLIDAKPHRSGEHPGLRYRSDDILNGLKRLAEREGSVSSRLIDEHSELPSSSTVANRFGGLSAAYAMAGLVRLDGRPVRYGLGPTVATILTGS